MKKLFISGSAGFGTKAITSLPTAVTDYIKQLDAYTEIIIGDCQGVDTLVQNLINDGLRRVTVYCSGSNCRNLVNKGWNVKHIWADKGVAGREFFAVKDRAMCNDADYGLAIWDEASKGTKANIDTMRASGKTVYVYRTDLNKWE